MNTRYAAILVCIGMLTVAPDAAAAVTFSATEHSAPVGGFATIVSGDFDGDGRPDLVTLNQSGSFSLLAGAGDGTFLPPITTELAPLTTDIPFSIVAADLDVDGTLDLAIGYSFNSDGHTLTSTITIHLGDGTGHFSGLAMTSGEYPVSLTVGDFTGDGTPDLVVAAGADDYSVWIHPGNGDGTFQPKFERTTAPSRPGHVVSGDLDRNGHLDVVVGSSGEGGALIVWFDAGLPSAHPLVTPTFAYKNVRLTLGDLNSDGYTDVVFSSWIGGFFGIDNLSSCLPASRAGDFRFRGGIPGGGGGRAVLADFNTDGYLDIAGGSIVSGTFWKTVSVTLGHGDLEFLSVAALFGALAGAYRGFQW